MWGVRGGALSQPRPLALWACGRGPLPTGCGCGGVRAWAPVTFPTARAVASWLCALWGRHKDARGGRLLPGYGASGDGRSPTPDLSSSGHAAGAHYPLAVGVGGCGRGDPSPTPQRALLRAGFARFGGGTRAPGGGASCLGVGRPGSGALPTPATRPLGVRLGPTTHWLWVWGGAGVGTRHQPHSARSCELALRAVGAAQGRPGGAPLAWVWGAWGQALSQAPTARPLGVQPGPTTHWLWVCGGAGVGTRHQPHSARSRELALRAVGAARGRPGGAPLAWVWGAWGRALSHPRPLALWACDRGPLPTGCGCVGVRAWGPVTNPTARALASWLGALWGWHEDARGGRLLPGCGAPGVRRSPKPPPLALWAYSRGPLPTGCGCVGVRAWGPVTNPTARALASWLCALWGRREDARGGAPLAWVWGAWGQALSHPRPLALWACGRGPLFTGCGCLGVRGDPSPTPQRALLLAGFARCGGGTRTPGGGTSCLGVGRRGSGALPPPTARPLGVRPGPTTHWLWVCGGAGVGTRHQPHSARSRELALRPVGAARGRPGGAPLAWVWGAWGQALSHPRLPALWACGRGPLPTCCGCGGVRAWGPVTNPTARALASWLCALWGRREDARGGRFLPGCGAPGVRRSPTPDRSPSGRAAGAHYPLAVGVWGCGRGDPSPNPQRALLRAGFARCGGGARTPGGGASCLGVGRLGSGALPPPTARPLGVRPGPTTHWLWVWGGAGVGTRHQPPSARSCELALRAVGAARRRPGGAPLAWVWGAWGQALSHPRPLALWACGRGPLPTGCGCGVQAWGPGSPWHLLLCRGSLCVVRASRVRGTRWPLWLGTCPCAVVVAGGVPLWRASWPRVGAPCLVRSGRSPCSGRLFRRRGAFPHPGGLRPRIYWAAARGTRRPAENRAHCACRWPPPKQGRWARLASYPFGAPRWGCPWRVPPASVLGCVRCGCVRVWTRSLTRPVSRTVRRSTGDSAGAPGLFRVDADTAPFGSEDATPGSRACVGVRALLGRVGRAGLPGAFWCASPSPVAAFGALLVCLAPSGLGSPCLWLLLFFPFFFFFFFSFFCFRAPPPLSPAFRVFRPGVPWALARSGPPTPPPPFFFFSFPSFLLLLFPLCGLVAPFGYSLVVPVLCVLLPVVWRCRGVFCVSPGAVWRACVGLGACPVLLPPVAVAWPLSWSVVVFSLGRGAALLCSSVVRCGAVCVVSCWWCCVVSFAPAGAVCCCLWLPAVRCWVWLPAVVFRWCVLSRLLLFGRCPSVCCGLLWCPAPLCCVPCSVVLCRRVVPCCVALLSVFLCWWCWFVSLPCLCGAALCCASCRSVPVWSALLLVPRAVVCRCVLWCLPLRSVVWWCCSGVSWALAVPCCVLRCCAALRCRAAVVRCVLCFAAGVPCSF